jgi:alpha-galactosidase
MPILATRQYTLQVSDLPAGFSISSRVEEIEPGLELVHMTLNAEVATKPAEVVISWEHPLAGAQHKWTTAAGDNRRMMPWDESSTVTSKACGEAPVYSVYDGKGTNSLTFAHSDALNLTRLRFRVVEETACATCAVHLFCEPLPPMTNYALTIRMDTRSVPYHQSLRDVSAWWEQMPAYTPMLVPETARMPMYSTWYSFHQPMTADGLEEQCRLAKELGMDAIIVDDGWQTDDNNRGYSHCGDWEIAERKFPDMAAHVARVHDIGLKYIVWFSVPFVGIRSNIYETFKGKCLSPEDSNTYWYVLDPRFPDVREYLISIYERFVREYDIDGFKLDFVDSFNTSEYAAAHTGDGRDIMSVPVAVDRLLTDTTQRLTALKPDMLIEFRQSYIGPLMRKYGNMFRAGDVPNDFAGNRIATLDIRLLCGSTACHSDMTMWHRADPVESAAMQLIHTLFSVPQISVLLDRLSVDHQAMLRTYLAFWREHRDVLLGGTLLPEHPEHLYTAVQACTATKYIAVAYGVRLLTLPPNIPAELLIVNGTMDDGLVLDLSASLADRKLVVTDCCGRCVYEGSVSLTEGVPRLSIPSAGYASLIHCTGGE